MKVLITGSCGYIGAILSAQMIERAIKYSVVIITLREKMFL